jgi:hypothetical protein
MQLRIKRIDKDGFCGREHHPESSDIGLVVTVARLEALFGDNLDPLVVAVGSWLSVLQDFSEEQNLDRIVYMWTGVTEDNRILELMEHEVEVLPFNGGPSV